MKLDRCQPGSRGAPAVESVRIAACNARPSPLSIVRRLVVKGSRAMKIGIIGAGQIGGTLARRLTALGHEVFVANSRGPETLSHLAAETGATAVSVSSKQRSQYLLMVPMLFPPHVEKA